MAAEDFARVEAVLGRALELPAGERAVFVEQACAGDEALLAEVRSLLAADERAGDFLDQPLAGGSAGPAPSGFGEPAVGTRIGPYRLVRRLGAGGMSVVYLAEREDAQYTRRVAIKLVGSAPANEAQIALFRAERQILAGLEHPGIARLYDGGTTGDGLPYFVLEYVEGEPIDDYCDRHRLSVGERLALFRQVCAAVRFAHQNLVVHRDLKPGNILVTAAGVPKLLDFGIAKLLLPDPAAAGAETTLDRQRWLTPEYASPEQFLGRPVTTASDVYSLGMLLYKLLVGRLPFRLDELSPAAVENALVELTPPRPSTVPLDDAEATARARQTSPGGLRRQLAGDLDNIVRMALRKEPGRRYGSAAELDEDLRRHLEGRPVVAHPDSLGYRTGKTLRRHRLAVALATAVAVVLVVAAALLAVQSARLADERDRARRERDRAQRVAAVLEQVFEPASADPERPFTAPELLERGVRSAEALADHPEAQATLLTSLGRIYRERGDLDRAVPLLERALALRRAAVPRRHAELAESLRELALLRRRQGSGEAAEALEREARSLAPAMAESSISSESLR